MEESTPSSSEQSRSPREFGFKRGSAEAWPELWCGSDNMVAPGIAADVDAALVALQNAACDADEAAAE